MAWARCCDPATKYIHTPCNPIRDTLPLWGHKKHLARSVRAPWRPGMSKNCQGSRYTSIHPKTSQANTSRWAGPKPIPNQMPNLTRDLSRDLSGVLILPRACAHAECNTMRTHVDRSTPRGVSTRLKTVRDPGDNPNFPKPNQHAPRPRNAPKLART